MDKLTTIIALAQPNTKTVTFNATQETLDFENKKPNTLSFNENDTKCLDKIYAKCKSERQKVDIASSYFWTAAAKKLLEDPNYRKSEKKIVHTYYEDQIYRCAEILRSGDLRAIIKNINSFPNPQAVKTLLMERLNKNKKPELNVTMQSMNDKYLQTAMNDVLKACDNPFRTKVTVSEDSFIHYQTTGGFKLQPGRDFVEFKDMLTTKQLPQDTRLI